MKTLEQKILNEGTVLKGNILKVDSFLNQQLDVDFLMQMGEEIKNLYSDTEITKILTIESSGIAIAVAAGAAMHLPVVFAKKSMSANVAGEVLTAGIHSYTHGNDYTAIVTKKYISKTDKILIVDDFLASGEAIRGLLEMVGQAGAEVAGITCAIEKGFQNGGDDLRKRGYRVESLAIVESMDESGIVFRK